ncbi:universal stress protein [Algihabitans albus]|uniref:universal stress protein n=1 Tax=Algihabitans albus TaxID=2164067 RepID=UPI000E5D81B5|nr:universal stress protein [Algihabitans albus]
MPIKTILVHLANDAHHVERLDVAVRLAKQHNAHITALFITFPVGMPASVAGRGASAVFLAEAQEQARARAAALEKEFEGTCSNQGVSHTWVVEDGSHQQVLSRHAHVADLMIVSHSEPGEYLEDRFRLRLAEELVLEVGCPVLLLPRLKPVPPFGENILIGWRSNREAVRAVRGSLDLLRAAGSVTVATVGPTPEDKLSEHELVAYLARHGIRAEGVNLEEEDGVGATLLAETKRRGNDLLIMGAYGRSRLREVILGGATREVLRNAEIPILVSH